jgi:hypothetical protein
MFPNTPCTPSKIQCPYCKRVLDVTAPMREGDELRPGSVVVCSRCAGICIADNKLVPIKASLDDLATLARDHEAKRRIAMVVRQIISARHARN